MPTDNDNLNKAMESHSEMERHGHCNDIGEISTNASETHINDDINKQQNSDIQTFEQSRKAIENRLNNILEMDFCQTKLQKLNQLKDDVKRIIRELIDYNANGFTDKKHIHDEKVKSSHIKEFYN